MAVCNLFNRLNKTTGNFLLFSQYTEDLTRSNTHPGEYRVVPSRFVVLNVDYQQFTPFKGFSEGYTDSNVSTENKNINIPTYLQNYFENGCTFLREELGDQWEANKSKNLFWNALYDANIIKKSLDNICESIMYIGDINIQTYDEYLGTGYSEIYCNIPSDSKAQKIHYIIQDKIDYREYIEKNIKGYKPEEYNEASGMCKLDLASSSNFKYYYNPIYSIQINEGVEKYETRDLTEYDFNTIVLLYDIYDIDAEGKYILSKSNIPMGMYICGTVNEDGTVTNPGKKIVTNDDIYGMGTSYGLRICSRFVTTPSKDNIKPIDIKVECDNSYAATCMVLSKFAESMDKMNKITEQCVENSQISKELLAIFKNSRTNVPYIKTIGDESYWFINGRNTLIPVQGGGGVTNVNSITKEYIDKLFEEMRLKMALGYM